MPIANFSNMSSFTEILAGSNVGVSGWFWTVMVYMIYIILIVSMLSSTLETSIIVSSVIMLFLSLILAYAGLVAWWVVGTFFGVIITFYILHYWISGD